MRIPRHRCTYADTKTNPVLTTKYPQKMSEVVDVKMQARVQKHQLLFSPITHTEFCTKMANGIVSHSAYLRTCIPTWWNYEDDDDDEYDDDDDDVTTVAMLAGLASLAAWYGIFSLCWCVWRLHHGRCGMLLQDTAWHHYRAGDRVRELITSTHCYKYYY